MPSDCEFVICPMCGVFTEPSEQLRATKQASMVCAEKDCRSCFRVTITQENGKNRYNTVLI